MNFKVTNQMITACKSYISDNGTQTIWSQTQTDLIRKLRDCIKLNEEYQNWFQRTKEKLSQMPDERPLTVSEMYIFGKFDTFTRRCQKIIDMFDTINQYSKLQDSKIEGKRRCNKILFNLSNYHESKGIDMVVSKFSTIVSTLKKKGYDFLDQRKTDFDNDYDEFRKSIQELHVILRHSFLQP